MPEDKKGYCWFGSHRYEIYKEINATDIKDNLVGIIIITKCTNCGKIKHNYIHTIKHNYN